MSRVLKSRRLLVVFGLVASFVWAPVLGGQDVPCADDCPDPDEQAWAQVCHCLERDAAGNCVTWQSAGCKVWKFATCPANC
jgi:hypothetical protein